ncbi:hypothetical protein PSQ19_14860 [Devosia algicola]|uniref:Uncharacterized protein n=1 Tax=Devosia algicola TaxID=3026418 RepID=A0ABY7YLJ2_9HYPH|nr:hypothetical protein [Devosia algicola]WDR01960.1 hypothetical protein PSQ19_14860 [Devosia algicola]
MLRQLNVDGTFYSVAVDVNSFQLFYNQAMLDKYGVEPPESYGDLKHMAEAMNPDDVYPIAFFNRFPQRGRDYFYMIAGQARSRNHPQGGFWGSAVDRSNSGGGGTKAERHGQRRHLYARHQRYERG